MTPVTPRPAPGSVMAREMHEQPAVMRSLAARRDEIDALVRGVLPRPLAGTVLVARGSSDHAAVYGRYVIEYVTGRPVALAAPSLATRYHRRADLRGWLAVGVSQSGRTPEVTETLLAMREAGARTLALTNVAGSPLAEAAEATLVLGAGGEHAVPATKTFTAQLAAFAHVAAAIGRRPWRRGDWDRAADAMASVLDDVTPAAALADRLLAVDDVLTVARGFLYAAALEIALKVAETTGMHATAHAVGDLWHGPIAMARPGRHALCLVTPGPVARDVVEAADELARRGVTVHAITDVPAMLPEATTSLPVPSGIPEVLAPVVQVVRGQQLARELALARGVDPDRPHGLSKVTSP